MNKPGNDQKVNVMPKVSMLLSKIIIEEIAYQADLLATNAAMEGAYAEGENKGITQVASAVRNFAEKTATAAKEVGRVRIVSADALEKAKEYLQKVKNDARETAEIIQDITEKLQEASAGIERINDAMQCLNGFVQDKISDREEFSSTSCLQHISSFSLNKDSWRNDIVMQKPVNDTGIHRDEWSSDTLRADYKDRHAETSIEPEKVKARADADNEDLDGY